MIATIDPHVVIECEADIPATPELECDPCMTVPLLRFVELDGVD
jgi:hypothetical protein